MNKLKLIIITLSLILAKPAFCLKSYSSKETKIEEKKDKHVVYDYISRLNNIYYEAVFVAHAFKTKYSETILTTGRDSSNDKLFSVVSKPKICAVKMREIDDNKFSSYCLNLSIKKLTLEIASYLILSNILYYYLESGVSYFLGNQLATVWMTSLSIYHFSYNRFTVNNH